MKRHYSAIKTFFPVFPFWVEKIEDIKTIQFPTECVVLFIAADFSKLSEADLVNIAKALILKGLHYICCWGNECSFAHFCFDFANINLEIEEGFKRHIPSTSHNDKSIEESLWDCLFTAFPDEEYWDKCSTVVVGVGQEVSYSKLSKILDDIDQLNEMITNT